MSTEKRCQDCVVGKGGQGCLVPETCGKNGAGGDNPSQLGMECGACLKSGKGQKCGPSCPNEPPCQECISSGRGSGCLKDTACGTDGKGRFLAGKCNNDKPCGRCISHDAGHQQDGYCYNTQHYRTLAARWKKCGLGKESACADSTPLSAVQIWSLTSCRDFTVIDDDFSVPPAATVPDTSLLVGKISRIILKVAQVIAGTMFLELI